MAKMPIEYQEYTDWTVIKQNSAGTTDQIYYSVKNGICTVVYDFTSAGQTFSGSWIYAPTQLISTARPNKTITGSAINSSNQCVICNVSPNGSVGLYSYNSGLQFFSCVITFPTKE